MDDDKYIGHLLEEMRDELRAVHELVAGQPTRVEFNELVRNVDGLTQDVSVLKVAVADLSQDMKVVKAGVSDNSREVADHGHRITRLEAA